MKNIIFVLTALFFSVTLLQAQETPAAQLAHRIADKMKDSLQLTNQQQAKIFTINMDLQKEKEKARKKSPDRAVIGKELQQIENSRDNLYKAILTEQQFTLYKQKKRSLVSK